MPIPKREVLQATQSRPAASWILAPESVLGSLLSVALSPAQSVGRYTSLPGLRQPLSRRPDSVVVVHRFLRLLVALVEDRRSPPVQIVDRSEVIGPAVQADEEKKVSGLNGTAGWSTPAGSAGSRRLF